jgi:hypothetical protein
MITYSLCNESCCYRFKYCTGYHSGISEDFLFTFYLSSFLSPLIQGNVLKRYYEPISRTCIILVLIIFSIDVWNFNLRFSFKYIVTVYFLEDNGKEIISNYQNVRDFSATYIFSESQSHCTWPEPSLFLLLYSLLTKKFPNKFFRLSKVR